MKRKNTTRIIAIVLVLLMALALIPIAASADGGYWIGYRDTDGSDVAMTGTHMTGDSVNLAECSLSKSGYTFRGWATSTDNAQAGTVAYADKASVTKAEVETLGLWTPVGDDYHFLLYAVWGKNPVVTFHADYAGADPEAVTQAFPCDGTAAAITVSFTREGFRLDGWATESGGTKGLAPDASIAPTDGDEYYAVWVQQYTVSYDLDGGSVGGSTTVSSQTVDAGSSVSLPVPTKQGYNFTGWKIGTGTETLSSDATSYEPAASVTLTALWDKKVVAISYAPGDGTGNAPTSPAAGSYEYGDGFTLPKCTYTYTGHLFDGWKIGDSTTVQKAGEQLDWTKVTGESVVLTATWAETVTITYDPNGGKPTPPPDVIAKGSSLTSLPEVTKVGSTFQGWYNGDTLVEASEENPYSPTTNKFLTAHWLSDNITFSFKPGTGASGTMSDATATRNSGKYTLPTSSTFTDPPGKCLSGWSIGGIPYDLGQEYAIDNNTPEKVEVTALWDTKCTVTFKANGGTLTGEDTVYVAVGKTVPADRFPSVSPPSADYALFGWFDDTNTKFTSTTQVFDDMDVTAKWLNNTVVVTFDPNGGSGTADKQNMSRTIAYNLKALSELGFEKEGHRFMGWSRTEDGAKQFGNEESVRWDATSALAKNHVEIPEDPEEAKKAGKVTLFAVWKEELSGTVTIGRGTTEPDISDPKVNETLKAFPTITSTDPVGTLYYRWRLDGSVISDETGQTYTVPASAYGKKISVEVSDDPDFPYLIKSSELTVGANEEDLADMTVVFNVDDTDGFIVKVNDTPVENGDIVQIAKGGKVKVTLEAHESSLYVSQLKLGSTTIKDKKVVAVNPIDAPTTDTCTLTVTFAPKKTGTPKATKDSSADVSEAVAALTSLAKAELPAGYKDRYWVNAFDVVACWDGKVTAPLDLPGDMPPEGLDFNLPYPSGSNFNSTVSSNMPKYYTIKVYHFVDGTPTEISNYKANKAFAAGVDVEGQTDFSDFGMTLTPNALDGTVTLEGTVSSGKASVGAKLTAKYSKDVGGTLSYQWQYKDGSEWKPISGATKSDYTPTSADLNKTIRCVVTSDFETGKKESNEVTVVDKPNPSVIGNSKNILGIKGIIRGDIPDNTISYAVIGNVTSDMEWTGPSSSTPDSSATWKPTGGTSFTATEKGIYWVRTKDDTDSKNWGYVDVPIFYTINGLPGDSLSVSRIYYTSSKEDGTSVIKLSPHEWAVKEGTSVSVTVHSANQKYYKLTKVVVYNLENSEIKTKNLNKVNSYTVSFSKVSAPYRIYAWAGVYGAKTGDSSHLELWVELAVLSLMGLSAVVVFGRKKKQK